LPAAKSAEYHNLSIVIIKEYLPMSISSLGSAASACSRQTINSSSPVRDNNEDKDGSGSVSGARGGHRHHGDGAFMQDVVQTLQSLGLNLPAANTTGTNTGSTTDGASSTSQNTPVSSSDIKQALHIFLHDLRHAVHQNGAASPAGVPSSGATDADGDNNDSGPTASGVNNGYSDFGTNLQNLINSLGSNSDNNVNGADSTLQTDFSNLLTALGGNAGSGQTPPTLQDFLTKLASNLSHSGSTSSGSGTIFQTTA
jgi:hypothetical protein